MEKSFLLYGANGFVGSELARLAVKSGYQPILCGRNEEVLKQLADELDLSYRVFALDDPEILRRELKDARLVLHCAGPYIHTSKAMVDACLATGTHYLDITGEIPVFESIAARDQEAREKAVMLLPGIGFDVVPTDCLALHLKKRLPSATHLALAYMSTGPAGLPPGTQKTMIELIPYGAQMREEGALVPIPKVLKIRHIDFGTGPVEAIRLTWGDVFTAYYSTGIPNIENYLVLSPAMKKGYAILSSIKPLFKNAAFRKFLKRRVKPGPGLAECEASTTYVWGEVTDEQGQKAVARMKGPEGGLIWTSRAAFAAVQKVLAGDAPPGYQTPAKAYGADFVLECEGVYREDLEDY